MHYVKLVIAVAIGIALWQLAVKAAAEGSISNPYALMGAEAATIVAAMVVVGMIF
jgi:hypothetical protein